ncbi:MAG: hypothetical protein ACFE8A_08795 [Candidatus Hodarchaeota archaeon]
MNLISKSIWTPLKIVSIFIIFSLSLLLLTETHDKNNSLNTIEIEEQGNPRTSAVTSISYVNIEWMNNTDFSTGKDPWFNTTQGDSSDVSASAGGGVASYLIKGYKDEKQVILNSTTYSNWVPFNKTDLVILPDLGYGVDVDGAYCGHEWWENDPGEQPKNTPRMHWKINVSMPFDMSDYIITSADFEAIINASVDQNIDTPNDVWARWLPGQVAINQYETYDWAQFYVEISDLDVNELNTYRIAFNQTRLLGNENLLYYDMEGLIGTYGQQAIIDAITNVLAVDPGHNNFTVILGIFMYCEDNLSTTDRDEWTDMRFKSLNLTFTYEKKIDYGTSLSWNQMGNMINHTNEPYYSYTRIDDANLNFDYKIDKNWTETTTSPNSEIKFLINDFEQTKYAFIKLSSANESFQEAITGGYDVTNYIPIEENITLSIQVFMGDEFELNQIINISIDNVDFVISYTVFYNPPPPAADDDDDKTKTTIIEEPWFNLLIAIAAIGGAVCLGGYLVYYIRVLKYPKPVRKVRKYRRTLKRKKMPSVEIISRENAFNSIYREVSATSLLKSKPIEKKPIADKIAK